jgi:hypothetical protein
MSQENEFKPGREQEASSGVEFRQHFGGDKGVPMAVLRAFQLMGYPAEGKGLNTMYREIELLVHQAIEKGHRERLIEAASKSLQVGLFSLAEARDRLADPVGFPTPEEEAKLESTEARMKYEATLAKQYPNGAFMTKHGMASAFSINSPQLVIGDDYQVITAIAGAANDQKLNQMLEQYNTERQSLLDELFEDISLKDKVTNVARSDESERANVEGINLSPYRPPSRFA